jgi:hypothetical protein
MPKKAYLAEHLSSEELKDRYRSSKDSVETRRWHLLGQISLGWTIKNAAVAVGLDYQYSFKILKKYNELGEERVKNFKKNIAEHRRGKEPLLKEEQFQKLKEELKKRPADGGIWTGTKVARWIEKETKTRKSMESKGMGLLKKVQIFLSETQSKT